jgi:hypothetical protein
MLVKGTREHYQAFSKILQYLLQVGDPESVGTLNVAFISL